VRPGSSADPVPQVDPAPAAVSRPPACPPRDCGDDELRDRRSGGGERGAIAALVHDRVAARQDQVQCTEANVLAEAGTEPSRSASAADVTTTQSMPSASIASMASRNGRMLSPPAVEIV